VRGEEIRESTGKTDEQKALKFLQKRQREVGNDKDGIQQFAGPKAERIRVSCGVIVVEERKPDCDCLCCAIERDYRLRDKASAQNISNIKRVRQDFAQQLATRLTAEHIDAYVERRVEEGAAPASINRVTQLLGQAFKLAMRQKRLNSAPFMRRLSEIGNVRQGFYTGAEFEAIVASLPEYLQDFARWGFRTGMRKKQITKLLWEDVDHDVIRSRAVNVKKRKAHSITLDDDLRELIERRRAARKATRTDGAVVLAAHIFHRDGEPVGDIRKAWQTACVLAGLGRFLCRDCEVTLDAERKCPDCGKKWNDKVQPKYVGKLFHDFRRSAVRDMVRAGVPQSVAMSISGHSTDSMFRRYDIVDGRDQREALRAVREYQVQQAIAQREKLATIPAKVQ
jgi:integrase